MFKFKRGDKVYATNDLKSDYPLSVGLGVITHEVNLGGNPWYKVHFNQYGIKIIAQCDCLIAGNSLSEVLYGFE